MLEQYRTRDQVVLILDDDYDITESVAVALERDDRSVITCNDVETAQLVVERFRPSVVVSDVRLSGEFGFEGLEFISFVKRHSPEARVILMTGDAPERMQMEASQRGAVAFLQKPFKFEELDSVVDLLAPQDGIPTAMPSIVRMPVLEEIVSSKQLLMAYQPIVPLATPAQPIGFEALARYQTDSPLRNPELLFQYAARKQRTVELELACISRTLESASLLPEGQMLFINVHPEVLKMGPAFRDQLSREAERAGFSLKRVVLELTEQASLAEEPRIFKLLQLLRTEGVRFAFDDVGVAYSHLAFIDRIRPEFLKISQHFGTSFEADPTRLKLVRNLISLGKDFECEIILEGIEEESTAQAAAELGIRFGQGFLYGRPAELRDPNVSH